MEGRTLQARRLKTPDACFASVVVPHHRLHWKKESRANTHLRVERKKKRELEEDGMGLGRNGIGLGLRREAGEDKTKQGKGWD